MDPIYCAVIIGGPMALLTLHRSTRVLIDRFAGVYTDSAEFVPAYQRRYLLEIPPAAAPRDDVMHGVSDWQVALSALRIKPPRALCGESLVADGDGPASSHNPSMTACPRCVARAPWMRSVG